MCQPKRVTQGCTVRPGGLQGGAIKLPARKTASATYSREGCVISLSHPNRVLLLVPLSMELAPPGGVLLSGSFWGASLPGRSHRL